VNCQFDAYCGLYCGACDVLLANQEGRHTEMAIQAGNIPENFECHGCKSSRISQWCGQCGIRKCAIEKGVGLCIDCNNFPCESWQRFFTDQKYARYHKYALNNMQTIKSDGMQTWLEQQAKQWRCPHCGKDSAWPDDHCRQCGQALENP